MHAHVALARFDVHRRWRWLALGAASIAVDSVVVRRMAAERPLSTARWLAIDAADLALWSLGSRSPHDVQAPVVGNGWTHASLHAYRATVGLDAKPTMAGTHPYPPRTRAAAAARVLESAAICILPMAAADLVHRRRGVRVARGLVLWAVLGTVSGTTLGRVRRIQHERATELWNQRSELGARLRARSVRFQIVTGIDELHDLPRLLAILGEHSEPCRQVSLGSRDVPRLLASDAELGGPLGRFLPYHEVDPPSGRMLWLGRAEADALRRTIEQIEAARPASDDDCLRFEGRVGASLRFRYLGQPVIVRSGPSIADVSFDPVAAGLVASALVKLVTHRADRIPLPVGVACASLELIGAALTARGELTGRRHVPAVLGVALASSALWLVTVRTHPVRELRDDGSPLFAATGATSVLGPLAHYWPDLTPAARAAAPAVLLGWLEVMRAREHRPSVPALLAEAITVAQYFVATFRFAEAGDAERRELQERLQAEHDERLDAVEAEMWDVELRRYEAMVELASSELQRVAAEGALTPRDVIRLRVELDAVQRWIDRARGRAHEEAA